MDRRHQPPLPGSDGIGRQEEQWALQNVPYLFPTDSFYNLVRDLVDIIAAVLIFAPLPQMSQRPQILVRFRKIAI